MECMGPIFFGESGGAQRPEEVMAVTSGAVATATKFKPVFI